MMWRRASAVAVSLALALSPALAEKVRERDTIKSLESKSVEIRPGKVIARSTDLARDSSYNFV